MLMKMPGWREKSAAESRLAARVRARRARRLIYMAAAAWSALIGAIFVIVRLLAAFLGS